MSTNYGSGITSGARERILIKVIQLNNLVKKYILAKELMQYINKQKKYKTEGIDYVNK